MPAHQPNLSPNPHHSVHVPEAHDLPNRAAFFEPPITARWEHVHQQASLVAAMADLADEPQSASTNTNGNAALFAQGLAGAEEAIRTLAQSGLEDMECLLDHGIRALKEVEARGQDTHAPALALWREFYHAREAVLQMVQPATA